MNKYDVLLGYVIDEGSKTVLKTKLITDSISEVCYAIVGFKAIRFSTCEVADLGLENLPKYVNNLSSVTGYAKRKLCVITREDGSNQYRIVSRDTGGNYSESHRLASAFYKCGVPSNRVVDKDRWYSAKIKGNLTVPVYTSSGELFIGIHGNHCLYTSTNGLAIKVNYNPISIDMFPVENIGEYPYCYMVSQNCLLNLNLGFEETKSLYIEDPDNVYNCNGVVVVTYLRYNNLILHKNSIHASIFHSSALASLTLNKSLEYISIDVETANSIREIYISKSASSTLLGSLLRSLVNARSTSKNGITEMCKSNEYTKIWEYCNRPKNKGKMKEILDGLKIVVY